MQSRKYLTKFRFTGTLRKTTKSVLGGLIESKVTVCQRLHSFRKDTIHLIDAMALVQAMKSAGTKTFGELASKSSTLLLHILLAVKKFTSSSTSIGIYRLKQENVLIEVP